jgi:membrane-associated phospholipid phosphatase
LELSYLLCYPLVPLAFAAMVFWNGSPDHFWTTVLLAVFACYGLLPWLPTRPPRTLPSETEALDRPSIFRRFNIAVLGRASIQVNTFPSGHVAAALAAALAVGQVHPLVGGAIALLSVSIAVAAVVGRYHYAADVVLGAAVALIAFTMTR